MPHHSYMHVSILGLVFCPEVFITKVAHVFCEAKTFLLLLYNPQKNLLVLCCLCSYKCYFVLKFLFSPHTNICGPLYMPTFCGLLFCLVSSPLCLSRFYIFKKKQGRNKCEEWIVYFAGNGLCIGMDLWGRNPLHISHFV